MNSRADQSIFLIKRGSPVYLLCGVFAFQKAVDETSELKEDLKDMESLRLELADFFCEDLKSFKLEECFKILQTFCERFSKAKLVSIISSSIQLHLL